jgi:hypothetical protein
LLSDGTVLFIGGEDSFNIWDTSEIYNPATGTFSDGPNLPTTLSHQSATLLSNGKVLIVGGRHSGNSWAPLSSAMLYDPLTQTISNVANLAIARQSHTATLLNTGLILIISGDHTSENQTYNTAELYNPSTNAFIGAGATLNEYLCGVCENYEGATSPTATLLNDGSVLIVGLIIDGTVERYEEGLPMPISLQISPSSANMHTGDIRQFFAVDDLGQARLDALWSVNNTSIATIPKDSLPTVTAINPGHVTLTANVGGTIAEAQISIAPYSLKITPESATMMVGDERSFNVVDERGRPCSSATWMVSDDTLATITDVSSPTLTAVAAGTVTITATVEGVSAQAQVTIFPASQDGSYPPGTVLWAAPPTPGFTPVKIFKAMPEPGAPDFYSIQSRNDGQSLIQAFTADGRQMWQTIQPSVNDSSVPDYDGGLIITIHQTCKENQTDPMKIIKLDPATGQPNWQIISQSVNNLYCYPEAPQIAIRPDGNVVISAPGNTSGLPELAVVNGKTGQRILAPAIPVSSYKDVFSEISQGYSPIGPPFVDSDGSTYVEYEVRNVDYPPKVLSAELWLLKMDLTGNRTDMLLDSTADDCNLFPGRIIPDGDGGVLATWYVDQFYPPDAPPPQLPLFPYHAARVSSGNVASPYVLPFPVKKVKYGQYPILALGESGTAFATDGANGDYGPTIASFNLNSGFTNWAYSTTPSNTLSIMTAMENNGVVVKTKGINESILRINSAGSPNAGGIAGYELCEFAAGDAFVAASGSMPIAMIAAGEQVNLPNSTLSVPALQAERFVFAQVFQLPPGGSDPRGVVKPLTINPTERIDSAIMFWQQHGTLIRWVDENRQLNKQVQISRMCSYSDNNNCFGSLPNVYRYLSDYSQIPWFQAYFSDPKLIYFIFLNSVNGSEILAVNPHLSDTSPTHSNLVAAGRSVVDAMPHEVGHVFGLDHRSSWLSLMCGKTGENWLEDFIVMQGCGISRDLKPWEIEKARDGAKKYMQTFVQLNY